MSLISIGLSGLTASSAAINTIGNNTANVDTAGYSRQQTMTVASASQNVGVGFIGTGTTLSDVRRIYNSYLDSQLQSSTALNSDATAFLGQASSTDTLLSDSSTGISTVLSTFFTQLQGVSTTATDSSARAQFLTTATALSARFNSISTQLAAQNSSINSQLTSLAGQVNTLSSSIAHLNQQITQASASGATPNSLLDARNESVRQLNVLVGAKVVSNNGSYDVYIGTGQSLVSGTTANTLSAGPGTSDATQYTLKVNYSQTSSDVTSVVTGGTIGGLLRYRSDVLTPAANELGRVALVVSDQVNSQLNQGIDSNGEFGSNLFNSINGADQINQRSLASSGNSAGSGNLDVTIANTGKLTANDYQVTFTSSTGYNVKRLPDGSSVGSYDLSTTPPPVIDGFSLSLNGGGVSAGDSFKLTPTRNAAAGIATVMSDAKTIAAAAPLTATASASNMGSGTITQPVLTTSLDIYNSTTSSDLRTALKDSTPVKLVFGAVSGGAQSYRLLDAKGQPVLDASGTAVTGSIVPGQSNTLSLSVGYTDSSGAAQAYKFEMTVAGSPSSNDAYSISLTGAGSADNRNALAALALQTKQTVDVSSANNGMSLSGAYGKLIENVGAQASQAKSDSSATTAILTQAKSARDGVSGVNLDEEAANLVKYQQYYTASSQIIKAAQTIFSTLINSL
ncbi:flagellar hook-associated protein FlgK [Pseudomonas sp. RTC3]|uniref:flagellar hook-associated protein FlgK n=1 Tax=unclassified Pseudomonas TaxID=196821 RepID=UPI002AB3886F|nr:MULTISPECIES: flagellar hook-associated protein FlgK [unclassified Pseudomonas]MDY7563963.1 flagellar hook-associated protein FlgK [Pseudomonas sp. 5C2]MEB0060882.1 flagellar hook-associated protein FlgK [Pseudomonas sp. RTC3]MEB0242561.1 flagellar hook-associated protein FlgK [Pseudomonas sp. 5C2]MEE3505286.1 flagellar hook-associated protein FlgK [Pseudomonas sp. 10C3]